jgi:hypothetical protein
MFEGVLYRMREKIRARQYVMTDYGKKEMNDDGPTIYDVERAILNGEVVKVTLSQKRCTRLSTSSFIAGVL